MNKNYINYDDIINLPHHVSKIHPQMSMQARAAQFAPFAALTGYGDSIKETVRLTEERIELDEEEKQIINKKLQKIKEKINERPNIIITYFIKDEKKHGGKYVTIEGKVNKIDEYKKILILKGNIEIPINEIIYLYY